MPYDPWIRTHWKLGARIVKPIYEAFIVKGTIKEWEDWTEMSFPESGLYVVEGALQPIRISLEEDVGCYEDPNVWMTYQLNR
jgi:hypothetical protein